MMMTTSKDYNLLHNDDDLEEIEEISSIELLDNNILAVIFFHAKN